jgi:hypothetical protein
MLTYPEVQNKVHNRLIEVLRSRQCLSMSLSLPYIHLIAKKTAQWSLLDYNGLTFPFY